jgi:hypothetical protein
MPRKLFILKTFFTASLILDAVPWLSLANMIPSLDFMDNAVVIDASIRYALNYLTIKVLEVKNEINKDRCSTVIGKDIVLQIFSICLPS